MPTYIIAICAPPDTGKTSVLNNVWDLLPCYITDKVNGKHILHLPGAPRSTPEILGYDKLVTPAHKPIKRDFTIGVNSRGDDLANILGGLVVLSLYDSDIIVCACHTEQQLKQAIDNINLANLKRGWHKLATKALGRNPTDADLSAIKAKILSNDCEIILYHHFCKVIEKRYGAGTGRTKLPPFPPPFPEIGGVDLSRLSAQQIVDLTERLMN